MKIKAILNLGAFDYPEHQLLDGQVEDVPEAIGLRMVARKHAVAVIEEPPAAPEVKHDKKKSRTIARNHAAAIEEPQTVPDAQDDEQKSSIDSETGVTES